MSAASSTDIPRLDALPDGRSRRLEIICLSLALLVHGPILSLGAWQWIMDLFSHDDDSHADQDVEVPMQLDLEDDPSKSDAQEAKVDDVILVPDSPDAINVDGGTAVESKAEVDASVDAGSDADVPSPPPDAGPPPKAPTEETPLASIHAPANPSGNTNNVEIVLVGKVLRRHPIGLKLGEMLPDIKQWASFFDKTGIDAVRDVDLMVIMGPEVAAHNDQVDVMMLFNTPPDQIHAAVDKILARSSPVGGWMEDSKTPAAIGKVEKANRIFVQVPKQNELYVTPFPRQKKKHDTDPDWSDDDRDKAVKDKIDKIAKLKAPSTNVDFGINFSVKEPGKLSKIPVPIIGQVQIIPDSFEKFVLRAYPLDDGGGRVRIELWDDNHEDAVGDLPNIQGNYEMARTAAHAVIGLDLPEVTFAIDPRPEARGRILFGEGIVSREFLDKIIAMGEEQIKKGKSHR